MMPIIDWVSQQGSADWYRARAGIPTASEFHHIMTPKLLKPAESRKKYACRLIAERLMNWQADSLDKVDAIAAGKENEPLAVRNLELVFDIETELVGFITTDDGRFGASPDRVAGVSPDRDRVNTTIEIKCPSVPIQFERLIFGDDEVYKCQRQGQLWVAQADKAIFFSYHPYMSPTYMVEDGRDEVFITKLADCLERFSDELEEWTLRAKSRGVYHKLVELPTPVDAAYRLEPADTLDDILDDKW